VIKVPECPYPPTPEAMHPISNDLHSWYEQEGPDVFSSTYLKVVGGTTWHWLGTCLRFVPNDFRLKTQYGQAVDWPLTYEELEPFYARAEEEIGVAGDAGDDLGAPRGSAYPMPAIPQTFLDKTFARALVGTDYQVRSTPQGRLSQDQSRPRGALRLCQSPEAAPGTRGRAALRRRRRRGRCATPARAAAAAAVR